MVRHVLYQSVVLICVMYTFRSYWIVDMQWTYDDLLLAVINAQGSVCLVPRLGEPLLIQIHGCATDIGPALFPPLLPLICVQ